MGIQLKKSRIPIIWLDTFAIIEIYKYQTERSNDPRIIRLYDIIQEKVAQKKLICPLGEQEEEIEENEVSAVIRKVLKLSLGINFLSYEEIKQTQIIKAMKSYRNYEEIEITYLDAFRRDPIAELNNKGPFIFSVLLETSKEEKEDKKMTKIQNLEELQLAKNRFYGSKEFASQIDNELNGYYEATLYVYEMLKYKTDNKIQLSEREQYQVINMLTKPLSWWSTYHSSGLYGYLEFLKSNEYKELPHVEISSYMTADLFTSKRKSIETGDPSDILNISTLLPYCDYVLTDKDQMKRVKRLELDKKYNAKVYSLSIIDQLFIDLEEL